MYFSILFASYICIVFAPSAVADTSNPDIPSEVVTDTQRLESKADLVKVIGKFAARPFVEITLLDKNGMPVSPDMVLTVGRAKILVRDYLKQLNELERSLNQIGRSLRDEHDFGMMTQIPTDTDALSKQSALLQSTLRRFDPDNMRKLLTNADLEQQYQKLKNDAKEIGIGALRDLADKSNLPALDLPDSLPIPAILPVKPVPIPEFKAEKSRTWNVTQGDKSVFGIYADATLAMNGFAAKAKSAGGKASANFGAYLFGSSAVLGSGTASYIAPNDGPQTAAIDFKVLGKTIYHKSKTAENLHWGERYSPSVDKHVSFHFAIGVIPCEAQAGAKGSAFLGWGLGLTPLGANGQTSAGVEAEGYASVAASIEVAELGVKGTLLLLRDTLTLDGGANVRMDERDVPYVDIGINAENTIEALNGALSVYAAIELVDCNWCSVFKKSWEQELFHWNGIKSTGNILSFHYKLSPLGSEASGKDILPEDNRQAEELLKSGEAITLAQRENLLINAQNRISADEFKFFSELGKDLQSEANQNANIGLVAVTKQSDELERNINDYLKELL